MNILLDKICAKMPQLDGVGCVVTEYKPPPDYICSKCIITKSLNIAKEKWPCEGCDSGKITHTAQDEQYTCDCPECHGLGISREAFVETCPKCHGTGGQMPVRCKPCCGMGQNKREPWEVVEKLLKREASEILKFDNMTMMNPILTYYKGQFFQLFWLWEQLRELTGDARDGKEE